MTSPRARIVGARQAGDRAGPGYGARMDNDKIEAIQNVVDRVSSYQDGAPEGTVESELRSGLAQAGVDLQDHEVSALTSAIEGDPGGVAVGDVLG